MKSDVRNVEQNVYTEVTIKFKWLLFCRIYIRLDLLLCRKKMEIVSWIEHCIDRCPLLSVDFIPFTYLDSFQQITNKANTATWKDIHSLI